MRQCNISKDNVGGGAFKYDKEQKRAILVHLHKNNIFLKKESLCGSMQVGVLFGWGNTRDCSKTGGDTLALLGGVRRGDREELKKATGFDFLCEIWENVLNLISKLFSFFRGKTARVARTPARGRGGGRF